MKKDIFADLTAKDFNNCVDKGVFPDDLNACTCYINSLKERKM